MTEAKTAAPAASDPPGHARVNYLNETWGLKSWLLTLDHKRIGILYLISVSFYFAIGGLMAALIRIELATPQGDLVSPDWYNRLFTMHGVMMIFFFLIPAVPGVLGNFLLPLMIGAKDVAFPKLNLASWYLYNVGALFAFWALLHGGVDTGWTFYTPLSTTYTNTHVIAVGLGIFINGFSSILAGVNFMVTIHRMRAPGQGWFRLPLFVWGIYATSLIQVLGTPVLAITILLLAAERLVHIGIFDPAYGGDPVLFQHFFWFYSHPAVYIMILPAMGVISEIVAACARKRIFGYKFVAFASVAIATLGFLVWAHHMFISGMSIYAGAVFSILTMFVAVPSAVKVFNWTATLYKGSVVWETPMLYALGFIGVFVIGGLTGTMLATMGLDAHIHDTYFLVAHFHYVMVGSAVMGYLGGIHFWWPKVTGRLYPAFLSKFAAIVVFIGFNVTFFPQFLLGYLGMPRRYHTYPPEFQTLNVMSSAGATILGVGYLIPMLYLVWSLKWGPRASANPWGAVGLEWETTSPPPTHNFATPPVVTTEAYDYAARAAREVPVGL
ncbi:MAG TPA: cytochrome c oxidase subunit I [Thermoanaerobaculia bacterium]|nr:cytochrome c oxidase subunit I [Thermoanaerobaculia bacterium]